jgi:hypothetical protein
MATDFSVIWHKMEGNWVQEKNNWKNGVLRRRRDTKNRPFI